MSDSQAFPIDSNNHFEADKSLKFDKQAYFQAEIDNGNSGTSDTIDWTLGNKQKVTLTGNCTFTFTAPTGATNLSLRVIGNGTGYTPVWPATVKWDGTAPTFTGTVSKWKLISFYFDGTNYTAIATNNEIG